MAYRQEYFSGVALGMLQVKTFIYLTIIHAIVLPLIFIPAQSRAQSTQTPELFLDEVQTVYLTNLERREAGLPPLRWNRELSEAARDFALDVVTNLPAGYCSHTDSTGRGPGERMRVAGYTNVTAWGENSVCGYATPAAAVRAWMNSPSHKANMLDTRFREIGVGYARNLSNGRGYIVQDMALDRDFAPVIINDEAPSTTSANVKLYIYSQEMGSGFTGLGASVEMMVSNEPGFDGAAWQVYQAEIDWTLASGDGWKSVYVKTRDALGRTALASDTIYLGSALPSSQLSFDGASQVESGFRLNRIDAGTWPKVQFSMGWVGDNSDPTFAVYTGSAQTTDDPTAVGGTCARLQPGSGTTMATVWTSGHLATSPGVAYFRVKVADNSSAKDVLRLRVVVDGREVASKTVRGVDFTAPGEYQEFAVPYDPASATATSIMFYFERIGPVAVDADAVSLYTPPVPASAPLQWQAPNDYLRNHGIQARFVDDSGAFSTPQDLHTQTGALSYQPAAGQLRTELNVTPPSVWMEAADSNQSPAPAVLNVLCVNCVDGPWQAETDEQWLQLSSTNDTLQVTGVPTGLTPGIYQGEVLVSLPSDTSVDSVLVQVTMTVGDIDVILPEKLYLPAVVR